ncbi:MAG: imidazoleglycerol-phosphate dehydratase HisB [Brevundimonas sp.]|uniref:Imidazoleglycerol-phosphate dehydratase n=1 Tax=Brevundimonas albigilva TaxID=1312364 RepID=A0ABY4SJR2_9CAUL|nr:MULTISPECIES: imidazoleglycerol-phosphate dehydratase HisB [Brevundimonas]PZU59454.1 MAG: imidazoleglycerol-phosphate dehydratase HisB [Brevundimonas sp.]UQV17838.1 imidazoleglycerol-phosphate dehydratase HisB [Brevundimonas albigilva]URI14250.1 imidazoleglycerol-phosphate dehydratase HisB [Brevundimonas albigilva]
MTLPAPYPPLASGGDGLDRYPTDPRALAARMAAIYGAPVDQVLPVRGLTHGLELVWRLAARDGGAVEAPKAEPYDSLAAIYPTKGEAAAVVVRALGSPEAVAEMAARVFPALLVVDEGLIEFSDSVSAVTVVADHPNLVVLRSLSLAYGLAGARVGAAVARPEVLARLASVREPYALPEPLVRLAMQALDPSRMIETGERIASVRRERERIARELGRQMTVEPGVGPIVMARPENAAAMLAALRTYGVDADLSGDRLRLPISIRPEVNDRLLAAFGLTPAKRRPARVGQAVRDTKETRIVCAVDLDAAGPIRIETGVGFFDHMLEQIAAHGGFSLRLQCEGDLHTDPHHTIEDSAIALGQALKQALGERRGIARYGFVLAMDEAEAHVALDLSGRPYPVFEGRFETPYIGEYRTDLTAHVFRSLAEAMGAAVHIKVTGQDDHHKTEAAYKGFGRALRQAIRIEGDAVPSTKGVL